MYALDYSGKEKEDGRGTGMKGRFIRRPTAGFIHARRAHAEQVQRALHCGGLLFLRRRCPDSSRRLHESGYRVMQVYFIPL